MKLNLLDFEEQSDLQVNIDYYPDFSDYEDEDANHPFKNPVHVTGIAKSDAGILYLDLLAKTDYNTICDRCFLKEISIPIFARIQGSKEDIEHVAPIDGMLDIDAIILAAFLFNLPAKRLCKDDCLGLCPVCGCNLNEEKCSCNKKPVDPRLAVLKQLLDEENK